MRILPLAPPLPLLLLAAELAPCALPALLTTQLTSRKFSSTSMLGRMLKGRAELSMELCELVVVL